MGYIYFCRVKNQPKKGYIGQDSRDISTLARIKEHIDAAYKPDFTTDGCAVTIRVSGCCAVEGAFFDSLQDYGLPIGVVEDFKKHGTVIGNDLDLAEMLHIVGSHLTSDVTSTYNRLIGGQNIDLIYNGPVNDKYGLALQKIFGQTQLPEIKINRGNPVSAGQKAVYPGQYQILKEFVDSYVMKVFKDEKFLNEIYKAIGNTIELQKIVFKYMEQYIEYSSGSKKEAFIIKDNEDTLPLGKQLTIEIEDIIEEYLGQQEDIQRVVESLKEYKIHINKSHFSWKELALQIQTNLQKQLTTGKMRQESFIDLVKQEVLSIGPKNNDFDKIDGTLRKVLKKAIKIASHKLYKRTIPLQVGKIDHAIFYKKDITPPREEKPLGAKLLENYKIKGGITPQQQDMIFQGSRYRIYRNIDNLIYTGYNQVGNADQHNDFLMARIHSNSPFSYISFESGTEGIYEVLTAYILDYKDYRGAPVEYSKKERRIVRGGSGDSADYVTRDDLLNKGRPVLYGGKMTRLAFYPKDTKTYY